MRISDWSSDVCSSDLAAHGLAGVVDDEVLARARGQQLRAESLDAGRVPQVQAEHFQAVAPVAEVGFGGVARSGVARDASGDDQFGAGAERLQAGLVAGLHPSRSEEHTSEHPSIMSTPDA